MKCPYCGKDDNEVAGHYKYKGLDYITFRYRKCKSCGSSFRTVEEIVLEKGDGIEMDEQLMFNEIRELCKANGKAIDRISNDCNIKQDLVAKMFMETMQLILDNMKKPGVPH